MNDMQKRSMKSVSSSPTRKVSSRVARTMNATYMIPVLTADADFGLLAIDLTNNTLTQIRMMVANVLDITFPIRSNMRLWSNGDLEKTMTMMILSRNIPDAMRRSHFRYGEDLRLLESSALYLNTLVMAMMHHPRISVVMRVDRA